MKGETVVILRAGVVVDPYSLEEVLDWSDPTETPVLTVALPEPRPSGEPVQDARNAVTSGWTLYVPTDTDATSQDRVRVRGIVYGIEGEPASWPLGKVIQATVTAG